MLKVKMLESGEIRKLEAKVNEAIETLMNDVHTKEIVDVDFKANGFKEDHFNKYFYTSRSN